MLWGWLEGSIVKLERSTRPRRLFRHARMEWRERKRCKVVRKGTPCDQSLKARTHMWKAVVPHRNGVYEGLVADE